MPAMTKRVYPSAKSKIIETAKEIVLKEGLGNLTTDNLIAKSGLSKGGFFYHFKTKQDLIKALSDSLMTEMVSSITALVEKDKRKKGATLRAWINYTLSNDYDEMVALSRSLVEVLFSEDHDATPYKEFNKAFIKQMLDEGSSKEAVMTVMLIIDGYWYNEVFGVQAFNKKECRTFIQGLLKLTE
jgi:AcrR family transcriptional regulator